MLAGSRFTVIGTHQGEIMGATGKKITVHGIDMMRIVGGKVVDALRRRDDRSDTTRGAAASVAPIHGIYSVVSCRL